MLQPVSILNKGNLLETSLELALEFVLWEHVCMDIYTHITLNMYPHIQAAKHGEAILEEESKRWMIPSCTYKLYYDKYIF